MATQVDTGLMHYPYPLGKITPGGTTASVPLTQNIQPVKKNHEGQMVPDNQWNYISIQADPDNTGNYIFLCSDANAPDTLNYTNVIAKLYPGVFYPWNKEWANNRDLSQIFIGALNATDSAIVSISAF